MRVESLTAENSTLKSKIGRLSQDSEKLKTENTVLQVSSNFITLIHDSRQISSFVNFASFPFL